MVRPMLLALAVCVSACTGTQAVQPAPDREASVSAAREAALSVDALGCGPRPNVGRASLIDDGLAITAAHVVAGADSVIVGDRDGDDHVAQVVWFDPDLDLAVLSVPDGLGTPLAFYEGDVGAGVSGVVGVARGEFPDREFTVGDVDILRHVSIATTDIYLVDDIERPGFEVAGSVDPGDSGSTVVIDGAAAGVVWARSNEREGRAWAVDIPDELKESSTRRSLTDRVDNGTCVP